MKLRLLRESQRRSGIKRTPRNAIDFLNVHKSGTVGRFKFIVKNLFWIARRHEKVTVEAFEFTINPFVVADRFYPIDRRCVALCSMACAFLTMKSFQLEVAI